MAGRQSVRITRSRWGSAVMASEMARSSASTGCLRRTHSLVDGVSVPWPCRPSSASQPQPMRPRVAEPSVATVSEPLGGATTGCAGLSARMAAERSGASASV